MESPKGLILEGIRELSRGHEEEALEAFAAALMGAGDADSARLCLARLLILRRRYDDAIELLEDLARSSPGMVEAHMLLGIAHRAKGRLFDAVRDFRAVVLLDPGNERAEDALSEILEVQEP